MSPDMGCFGPEPVLCSQGRVRVAPGADSRLRKTAPSLVARLAGHNIQAMGTTTNEQALRFPTHPPVNNTAIGAEIPGLPRRLSAWLLLTDVEGIW
jgi:hypothetical protein